MDWSTELVDVFPPPEEVVLEMILIWLLLLEGIGKGWLEVWFEME